MRIILSPAKRMREDRDTLPYNALPAYLDKTEKVLSYLKSLTHQELKALWKCNDSIAEQNFSRLETMDLRRFLTPAILAYDGIAFQYMAPSVFEYGHFDYVEEHLRILSGFYGVLRPMDGVTPYRLEMQAKAQIDGSKDMYHFWGQDIYDGVRDESGVIINLASKEYSKCVEDYLSPEDRYITVVFCEMTNGKLVTKGTYAKMARGEMVRYMAENSISDPEDIKSFDHLGYVLREDLTTDTEYVFERIPHDKEDMF